MEKAEGHGEEWKSIFEGIEDVEIGNYYPTRHRIRELPRPYLQLRPEPEATYSVCGL